MPGRRGLGPGRSDSQPLLACTQGAAAAGGAEGRFVARAGSGNGQRAPASSLVACAQGLNDAALSPDGGRLASAGRDGVVRVHDLASGALLTGFRVRICVRGCKVLSLQRRIAGSAP